MRRMQVGLALGGLGPDDVELVVGAERLGVTSVWVAEAWGYDAMTPLAYLAARTSTITLATGIAQVGARTPAMLTMQAMSIQAMSGGRFALGLGASGPRIMEAWHGVAFDTPLSAIRETIGIVRSVSSGERLECDGRSYRIPRPGSGRPIRSMAPPVEVPIPIYVASLGPRSLEVTGELADGWLGNAFVPEHADVFFDHIRAGCEKAGRSLEDLDLVMPVAVELTESAAEAELAARRHADGYAFTIGAMGAGSTNFYNRAFAAQGFGDDVDAVHELWQAGRKQEAAARVPIEIGRDTNLLGTPATVRDRVLAYRAAGITTLQAKLAGPDRLDTLAQLVDIVREVDAAH